MWLSGKQYMFTFRHPVIVTLFLLHTDPWPHQRRGQWCGRSLGTPGISCVCACVCVCVCLCVYIMLNAPCVFVCVDSPELKRRVCSLCGLTGAVRAEVDGEDVVTEAGEVPQLPEVALQRAAGQTGFVDRSHEAKHKGVQTGRPTNTRMNYAHAETRDMALHKSWITIENCVLIKTRRRFLPVLFRNKLHFLQ